MECHNAQNVNIFESLAVITTIQDAFSNKNKKFCNGGNNYSSEDVMKLYITHGKCDQNIVRTCRKSMKVLINLGIVDM